MAVALLVLFGFICFTLTMCLNGNNPANRPIFIAEIIAFFFSAEFTIPLVKMHKVPLFKTREIPSGNISTNDSNSQYIIVGKVKGNLFLQVWAIRSQLLCK